MAQAQSPLNVKWEPKLSLTKKLNSRWTVNGSLGGLQDLGGLGSEATYARLDRLDARGFATYDFFSGSSVSLGYMYRKYAPLDEEGYEHRVTEQYSFYLMWRGFRLSNRIRAEQRFRNAGVTLRLRYRISLDFPLNGEKIDPGEKYLILSEEPVFSIDEGGSTLENRVVAGGGWQINSRQKLELSLQYRYRGSNAPMALHIGTAFYSLL